MYLADIRASDYEPLRSIPTLGLPDTFNEWAYKRREFSTKICGGGNEAIGVEVEPNEFADFCRDQDNRQSPQSRSIRA
jgi:hypothetical protein